MPDLDDRVDELAAAPKVTQFDGVTIQEHSVKELDEVAQRRSANAAVSKPHRGLRFNKLVPPGANG